MRSNEEILQGLFALQDLSYKDFQCGLMPNIASERVIGVRMPALRAYARMLTAGEAAQFLAALPHRYYEENNLHGLLLCADRDFERTLARLDAFLPYVDNWATCDLLSPKAFARRRDAALTSYIRRCLNADACYTIRFGIELLMNLFLDDAFDVRYLDWVAALRSEEYYVNMMIAWYFATALAKQYDAALPYLEQRRLDAWTHNRTIRKATESYRISDAQKAYLKSLKRCT